MKKMEKDRETDVIGQKIKEAFGFDDEQLLQELQMAEQAIPDEDLPEVPADGFEKLLARIEADNASKSERRELEKRIRRKRVGRNMRRGIVLAAALGVMMFATSIVGIGGKHYYFTENEHNSIRNDNVLNNDEVLIKKTNEEEAYAEIEKQLNMDILKVWERPEGMDFVQMEINGSQVCVEYMLDNQYIYMYEMQSENVKSQNWKFDGSKLGSCKNEWLAMNLDIIGQENAIGWEYTTNFVYENHYYIIKSSNISLDDFIKIISDLHY